MTDEEMEAKAWDLAERFVGAVESIAKSLDRYVTLIETTSAASVEMIKAQTEMAKTMQQEFKDF